MSLDRRHFLKTIGMAGIGGSVATLEATPGTSVSPGDATDRSMGVLVDIPNCIGCRKCEFACQKAAGFDVPPIESFDDKSVFDTHRRPLPRSHTTVNRFPNPSDAQRPIYVKANCLHCQDPACASACLVGALRKQPNGAVTYDAGKCMGCRYCMVACPFQIPTYDYDNAFTPQVRKCGFCFDKISQDGGVPACVQICPNDALVFGKRSALLALAQERIRSRPAAYVDHIYGEHEAGGTSWLYLSSVPFEQLGFVELGSVPPHRLTEAVQHGIFKFFVPPLALYGLLGLVMRLTRPDARREQEPVSSPRRQLCGTGISPVLARAGGPCHTDPGPAHSRSRDGYGDRAADLQEVGT